MSRIRIAFVSVVAGLALLAVPHTASAMAFKHADRSGNVIVAEGETIDDDLYVSGNEVIIRGRVNGSVFAAGRTISIEGPVSGDVWAAGTEVRISGPVGGSARTVGNSIRLEGRIAEDLLAAGSTVVLASEAGRDAAVAGNAVDIDGSVVRNLYVAGSDASISGRVGNDVWASVERLRLAEGSRIGGNLRYESRNEARIARGATVRGRTIHTVAREHRVSAASRAIWWVIGWIRHLVGLFLFGLVFVLLFPRFAGDSSDRIRTSPWPSLGIGVAVLFGVPVAAMIVFVIGLLVGGWWIALALFALWWIAIMLATVVTSLLVGTWLGRSLNRPGLHIVLAFLIGLVVVTLIEAIPVLGWLVSLAVTVFGLGALTLAAVHRARIGTVSGEVAEAPPTP